MTEIVANFDKNVDTKDFSFHFKKDKLGNKRPSVELKLPVPSVEGIVAILEAGGKQLELLQEALYDVVRSQAAQIVSDTENISQETFPVSKITWEAIANMPKADRRSSAITAEQLEAFAKDYLEVMPGVTGKSLDSVTLATEIYLKKIAPAKTNKPALNVLKVQLGLYLEHSRNAENFMDVVEMLLKKVDSYLSADDVALLAENL
jgi:hypothetical protein